MRELLLRHPYAILGAATWLLKALVTAFVGAIPAPTKDSTRRYVFWFKVANGFVGNMARARSTALESSPNYHDAIEKALAEQQK